MHHRLNISTQVPRRYITGLILPLLLLLSCAKEPIVFTVDTEVAIQTIHHDVIIPECAIYVQYHADRNEFPGFDNLTAFDTIYYTDDDGRAILKDLPLGTHWLYGRGYDDQIMLNVKGVLQINLDWRQPVLDTVLYVGEE
ncbi:MAG: hypothetical protein AAGK47_07900 [Bacteroidota bacterium]